MAKLFTNIARKKRCCLVHVPQNKGQKTGIKFSNRSYVSGEFHALGMFEKSIF